MASVLERIGQGLVSFGSGIPQSQIDTIRADRDIARNQARLQEQEIEANDAAAARNQRIRQLIALTQQGNPEAARELFQEAPDLSDQLFERMGATSDRQREEGARFAFELRNTPPDQREAKITRRVERLRAEGRNPSDTESLLGMSPEEQDASLRVVEAAALSARERASAQRGTDVPAEQQAFETLIADFSPEDQETAKRIKAGLEPRAVGSANITTATTDGLTDVLANSQATIRERTTFGEKTGASRAKAIDDGFKAIQSIDANIRNFDNAIAAIDEGASTGAVERFFPSFRESTIALEQVQKELGLDVIGGVTFGALSEGELRLALDTALPTGLEGDALREWIFRKQDAQRKLRDYYAQQVDFLDQGGTLAGFLRQQGRRNEEVQVIEFDAQGNPVAN